MKIEVLTIEGCPTGEAAWELVRQVVSEAGVTTAVFRVVIADSDDPEHHRFLGSPSVRINGEDIEPGRRSDEHFAVTCRVYRAPDGTLSGLPPVDMVRAALRAARESEADDAQG